jgi:hypothetical protein
MRVSSGRVAGGGGAIFSFLFSFSFWGAWLFLRLGLVEVDEVDVGCGVI